MSTLITFIQYSGGFLAREVRHVKEIKDIQIGKEGIKLSLLANAIILYEENSMESPKKLLEVIDEFYSSITIYKHMDINCIFIY